MEKIFTYLLYIHILCGSLSLVAFWIPAFTKKGNKLHRKAGWFYVYMMWVVVISAAILSIENALQGYTSMALFLGFLAFLSGKPLWHGTAVLRNKKNVSTRFIATDIAFSVILFSFGLFLIYYGLFIETEGTRILMLFFGFFGLMSVRDLYNLVKKKNHPSYWYQDHYTGMIVSGIAAYTAFLAFGGRQILELPGLWQVIPWMAPTIFGILAMRLLDRYYIKKGIIGKKRRVTVPS